MRRLSLGASFSRADSNTINGLTFSANHNEQVFLTETTSSESLRSPADMDRLVQGFSASGLPASNVKFDILWVFLATSTFSDGSGPALLWKVLQIAIVTLLLLTSG